MSVDIYAIVGGASVGKTSIINILKERGEIVCAEAATDLILDARERGNYAPWEDDGFEFQVLQEKLYREQAAIDKALSLNKTMIFTDRGLLDNVVYLQLKGKTHTQEYEKVMQHVGVVEDFNRYKRVFYVEPHSKQDFISEISGARYEETNDALMIGSEIKKIYQKTSMPFSIVATQTSPTERADFILHIVLQEAKVSSY